MRYTNIYSNIIYQKYLGTSIKVGCATRSLYASSGPKAEGVPTNNQRGRGSGSYPKQEMFVKHLCYTSQTYWNRLNFEIDL